MDKESLNRLVTTVIGCAIEVHRHLGPGLMESVYEACMSHELTSHGIAHQRQALLPVVYKGTELDCGYRLDLLIEDALIVELKTVDQVLPVHKAQLLTYLKVKGCWAGLLLNFNEATMKDGITRIVNGHIK